MIHPQINRRAGYAQYPRVFSIRRGWISDSTEPSSALGDGAVSPGDTFGISSWQPDHLVVSWGSATPATGKKSHIFATTVAVSPPVAF